MWEAQPGELSPPVLRQCIYIHIYILPVIHYRGNLFFDLLCICNSLMLNSKSIEIEMEKRSYPKRLFISGNGVSKLGNGYLKPGKSYLKMRNPLQKSLILNNFSPISKNRSLLSNYHSPFSNNHPVLWNNHSPILKTIFLIFSNEHQSRTFRILPKQKRRNQEF